MADFVQFGILKLGRFDCVNKERDRDLEIEKLTKGCVIH